MRTKFIISVLGLAALSLVLIPSADAGGRFRGGSSGCYSYYPSYSYSSYYPSYNSYYPQQSYTYTQSYQAAPAYTPPATPTYSPGWKSAVVEYAKQKDDQLAFFGALKTIGVNGNIYDYGYNQYAKSYANYAAPVVQGDTVYGYTVQQLSQAYGTTDLNVMGQQVARNVDGTRELHRELSGKQIELVQNLGDNQARLAEYLVKAQAQAIAIQAAAKAVEPQAQTTTQTTITGGGSSSTAQQDKDYMQGDRVVKGNGGGDFLATVGRPLCASCHSGANLKGKFDINTYPQLTQVQKAEVWDRLITADPQKRMPRDAKDMSKPGQQLTAAQLAAFFRN